MARPQRRSIIRSALGRRRIGKEEREAIKVRVNRIIEGTRGFYSTPIALKVFERRDPEQDRESRMYEDMCWGIVSNSLYDIFQKTAPASHERQEACSKYTRKLRVQLNEEIDEAREALAAAEKDNSSTYDKVKHRHRRYVAGYHQMLELMQQGEHAIRAAMEDQVIIFEGHRVNRFEFRKAYGW